LAASAAVLGRKAFGSIPPSMYIRPVHFMYGIGNNTNLDNTDATIKILVNYESPGPQQTIAAMTKSQQENVFTTTLDDLATYPSSDHLLWAPPFTSSYDPLDQGTWTWFANQL
jgi:hypothetical protein